MRSFVRAAFLREGGTICEPLKLAQDTFPVHSVSKCDAETTKKGSAEPINKYKWIHLTQ